MTISTPAELANDLLVFDEEKFRKFPDKGFTIRHTLSNRPEFQLPQLVELAQRLPEGQVEYYAGTVSVNQQQTGYPKTGLSAVETIRRIENCGSWMVLKDVGVDPVYGKLLRTALDNWYRQMNAGQRTLLGGRMNRERAFIFISSPNSVTPYHLDDEHNFLLQICGTKQVSMWDLTDRAVLSEPQAEDALEFWHDEKYQRYLPYEERFQQRANVYGLTPGEGLHFPFGAPHWVKNGPAVSISFSVTFRSDLSDRQAIIYYLNRKIRKAGLKPTPPFQSAWRDSLKLNAFQAARFTSRALRGSWLKGSRS